MMVRSALFHALLAASMMVAAPPGFAQTGSFPTDEPPRETASRVAFFERIELGGLRMSPVNIFYDQRCVDPSFCFTSGDMKISVVLFTPNGPQEVILRLGEPTPVPGGTLTLAGAGTPASENGAIELERYGLELVFRPGETGAFASARDARVLDPFDRFPERPIEFDIALGLSQILQQPAAEAGDHSRVP
jgi:hypothetical protein